MPLVVPFRTARSVHPCSHPNVRAMGGPSRYAVSNRVGEWTAKDYLMNGFVLGLSVVQHR